MLHSEHVSAAILLIATVIAGQASQLSGHTAGSGLGLIDGLREGDQLGEGLTPGVGVGDCDGEGLCDGEAEGLGLCEGVGS